MAVPLLSGGKTVRSWKIEVFRQKVDNCLISSELYILSKFGVFRATHFIFSKTRRILSLLSESFTIIFVYHQSFAYTAPAVLLFICIDTHDFSIQNSKLGCAVLGDILRLFAQQTGIFSAMSLSFLKNILQIF